MLQRAIPDKYNIINESFNKIRKQYKMELKYPFHFLFNKCGGGELHAISLPKKYIEYTLSSSIKYNPIEKLKLLNEEDKKIYLDFIIKEIAELIHSTEINNQLFLSSKKTIMEKENLLIIPSDIFLGYDILSLLSQIKNNSINTRIDKKLESIIKSKFQEKNYKLLYLLRKSKKLNIGPKDSCAICAYSFEEKESKIVKHTCNNFLCYDCFKDNLNKGMDTKCPFCKADYFIDK